MENVLVVLPQIKLTNARGQAGMPAYIDHHYLLFK
jgi:hypothetical protein